MGNILVSETTLKEERGACLHKLFQGLWTGLCDAQEGVWVDAVKSFKITITGVLTCRYVERSLKDDLKRLFILHNECFSYFSFLVMFPKHALCYVGINNNR